MRDYEKEPLAEAWAWEEPVAGGTWRTYMCAGWSKPSPDARKFNLRPLYAARPLKPQQSEVRQMMIDDEKLAGRIDAALDSVLKASGSALRHHTMAKTLTDMREAMRKVMSDAYIAGSNDRFEAMKKEGHNYK